MIYKISFLDVGIIRNVNKAFRFLKNTRNIMVKFAIAISPKYFIIFISSHYFLQR